MYDLAGTLEARPELAEPWSQLIPEWDADRAGALAERSAVRHAGALEVPVLLLHGRQDWRVSLAEAEAFAAALAAAGVEHELVVYEREEHQLVFHRDEWIARTADWFRAH
jgi:dipeptidyl aminopeptidase/acylaminoacyl peptidase